MLHRLAISNFAVHRIRAILTVAAIALSVSLVVAVTSGYASMEGAAYQFFAQFIGTTDASITRRSDIRGGIEMNLIDLLRRDPDVQQVNGQLEISAPLIDADGQSIIGLPAQVRGIRRPEDKRVERLRLREGEWFNTSDGNFAVIDQIAKEKLKVELGESFTLPGPTGALSLKVVGIIHKPGIFAQQIQTIYVPLETLQRFALTEKTEQVNAIFIDLRPGAGDRAFAKRWEAKLEQIDPLLRIRLASETREEMDRNLQGVHVLSYLGGTVSMLAAAFIVFSSLSMGVSERQRTLAMMRAIGAFRSQLAKLVMLEGAIVSAAGVAVGVPLGIAFMYILRARFPEVFSAGIVISMGGIAFAAAAAGAAALLASALPAWSASRVDPLEAMSPLAAPPRSGIPWIASIAGLILITVDPLIVSIPFDRIFSLIGFAHAEDISRPIVFFGHFVLGLPSLMLGWFLLAPLLVWIIERTVGPIVAAIFAIRFSMLKQQLSGGVWRAAGTCAALMVGLAILVVMHTQGRTALAAWRLPNKFPDVFITGYKPGGFNQADQQKIARVEGIRQIMPILYSPAQLIKAFFSFKGAEALPDSTLFIGVDPDRAFDMMELMFVDREGREFDPEQRQTAADNARGLLKQGRHIVVTNEFRELRGLYTGDTLTITTPKHGDVNYTIAGVVWSPGIDVFVSFFDLGQQIEQRTAASVFGSLQDARNDFGLEGAYLFAANLEYGVEKQDLTQRINNAVTSMGFAAYDVRQIKYEITKSFERLLLLVSTIAFAAMAVAGLGVTNTIMASVRTRQWQFGILRSVGVTRGGLLRLVLAESILIGIVGCALGLAAGLEMTYNARQLWGSLVGFKPPIELPWSMLGIGVSLIMLISLVASMFPAIMVSRAEPLELLQSGRAAG